ncbi:Cleavage stimulation factor subunit 50 [Vitis vinifera]|uniref:Cleavage stimulation factor 50 kDa subunit n=1 Tax=Vitis vinifera TaxID=29760 RepID=A0A438DJA2_VITVI|nr:Cleavage stimulation factor subunit 50 [Vitis vinifera]
MGRILSLECVYEVVLLRESFSKVLSLNIYSIFNSSHCWWLRAMIACVRWGFLLGKCFCCDWRFSPLLLSCVKGITMVKLLLLPGIPAIHSSFITTFAVHDTKGSSKSFPKHETRHVSEHKNLARCARFSLDGRFVATGSADMSIKLFEISKIKQMMLPDANTRDGPVRPVIRTFYDHIQVILTS